MMIMSDSKNKIKIILETGACLLNCSLLIQKRSRQSTKLKKYKSTETLINSHIQQKQNVKPGVFQLP